MVKAIIIGDRETIENYLPGLDEEPVIVTRESGSSRGISIIELGTSYPGGAWRGEIAKDVQSRVEAVLGGIRANTLIAEVSAPEYTVLVPLIARWSRARTILVEVSRLHPNTIATLKELSLLSHDRMVVAIYQRMAPRSRKIRRLFLETVTSAPWQPGFYTLRLKRLKSYVRAWLWYYEARDAVSEARGGGVPEYLVIDLESKLAEAERLLRGSEYTIVYPSVYDIKEKPPDEMYREAPPLMPVGDIQLHHASCYASIDLVNSGLVTGCKDKDFLAEEAIYLWLVKALPLPVWRPGLPPHLEETYPSYSRTAREASYRLHPWPSTLINPSIDAPWHIIPLYSMDPPSLEHLERDLIHDLHHLRLIISVATQCTDELRCTEAAETAGPSLSQAVRKLSETLDHTRDLIHLYRSIARLLGKQPSIAPPGTDKQELQENLALLAWILQSVVGLEPELADFLSLNAAEIAELAA